MAKGNMFQGMARGKVGDVVFSRLNGEQISRVRNRHPKNPRTNAQLYQRAIMATIMQAYSAGKEIFDHAYQGKSVPDGCMREFLSRNIKVLRTNIANDIANNVPLADQLGQVVAPKSITPVPVYGLIASDGELSQNLFTITEAQQNTPVKVATVNISGATSKVVDWLQEVGIQAGEIFTFVAFVNDDNQIQFKVANAIGNYGTQYNCRFGFIRFIVKENPSDVAINVAKFSDIFEIQTNSDVFNPALAGMTFAGQTLDLDALFGFEPAGGSMGIIRSNENSKLRSRCEMVPLVLGEQFGIRSQYVLDGWTQGTEDLGTSDLILEGGNKTVAGVLPPAEEEDEQLPGSGGV